jgi:hypothetical protein
VITPRATRLVRVPDLRAFRDAIAALACAGEPLDARDRLVVVPTRAAAAHLTRAIEDRVLPGRGAALLPELVTRDQLYERFAARVPVPRFLNPFEREALLGVACRTAEAGGAPPPFSLRPGLVAEILRFYDDLRRHENDVDAFEARALRLLEPGGLLYTASCSFHLTKPLFLEMLHDAAADSGRRVALREIRGQPLDHPEILTIPETGYIKGALLEAID